MARQQSKPKGPTLTADESLLIDVLAKTDELFSPYRWEGRLSAPGSIWKRRRRFATEGIVTAGTDTDGASRTERSRAIDRLAQAEILVRSRPSSRTRGMRLTPTADEQLRSFCGLPGLETSFALMALMVKIGRTDMGITERCPPATAERPAIREIYLLDPPRDSWPDSGDVDCKLALESQLAPALWRGFVEAQSDMVGNGHYMLTEEGFAILGDGRAEQRAEMLDARDKPKENDLAANLYWETRLSEWTARKEWADDDALSHIGVPLSCSLPTNGELAKYRQ